MKIGLIGNNISSSNAPDIHIRLAKIFQIPLEYLLFDLKDKEENYFVVLLEQLRAAGFKGVNNDSRKISFSCLLNDPSEFEGGELTLMPDSIGYPIQLKKYEICFFPSWMPHKVVPVTKGTRISLVGWVHGPDFV